MTRTHPPVTKLKLHRAGTDAPAPVSPAKTATLGIRAASSAAGVNLEESGKMLSEHLATLGGLMRELLTIGREKLAFMRTADADALHQCAAREARVLEQVLRCEKQRGAVLARVARNLQLADAPQPSLTEIAEQSPEPISSSIRARMRPLAEISSELKRINRVASLVARDLQGHIRGVFAALADVGRQPVGYGPQGRQAHLNKDAWLDAVG